MKWSVVIPTLNEERALPSCIAAIRQAGFVEVVVSDGGSRDATVTVAKKLADRVVEGPAGRGRQMNRGAAASSGAYLFFLHADAQLPLGWLDSLESCWRSIKRPAAAAFRIHYDAQGLGYRAVELAAHLRHRVTGTVYGDHGLALARSTFEGIGGFPDIALMEDVEMCHRLRPLGGVRLMQKAITVSARRLGRHPILNAAKNHGYRTLYGLGVSSDTLHRLYYGPDQPPVLLVFLKAPVVGRVKTRLAATLGAEKACALYRRMAAEVFTGLQSLHGPRLVAVYEASSDHRDVSWATGRAIETWPQASGDLGRRMAAAFDRAFSEGAKRVAAIGADSPGLPSDRCLEAFGRLEGADVVLGPTDDGGFYLVALRRPPGTLFDGVRWSSGTELEAVRRNAEAAGLKIDRIAPFHDIDEEKDLAKWPGREGV